MAVVILFCIGAQNSFAIKISIESKVADGPWRSTAAIEPLKGQAVCLRVKKIDGASIRWFQIVPDINIRYNNAVWPWLPNAYQVKNYIGIDCADVLMAAYCKSNNLPVSKDYNVAMLVSKFKIVAKSRMIDGEPESEIRWQKEVEAGDFIAVRYSEAGQYQHIGVLYSDHNENSILDGEDLILHAGPDPLHFSKLESGVFDGTVVILRTR
jgi:hypothetical protein